MATEIKPRDEHGGDLKRVFWMLPIPEARRWMKRERVAFGVFPCGGPDVEWVADEDRRDLFSSLVERVKTDGAGDFDLYENALGKRYLIFYER